MGFGYDDFSSFDASPDAQAVQDAGEDTDGETPTPPIVAPSFPHPSNVALSMLGPDPRHIHPTVNIGLSACRFADIVLRNGITVKAYADVVSFFSSESVGGLNLPPSRAALERLIDTQPVPANSAPWKKVLVESPEGSHPNDNHVRHASSSSWSR